MYIVIARHLKIISARHTIKNTAAKIYSYINIFTNNVLNTITTYDHPAMEISKMKD